MESEDHNHELGLSSTFHFRFVKEKHLLAKKKTGSSHFGMKLKRKSNKTKKLVNARGMSNGHVITRIL